MRHYQSDHLKISTEDNHNHIHTPEPTLTEP